MELTLSNNFFISLEEWIKETNQKSIKSRHFYMMNVENTSLRNINMQAMWCNSDQIDSEMVCARIQQHI